MKGNTFSAYLLILLTALLFSCSQDPIFYNISNETQPDKSLIPGIPGSFAQAGGTLYTCNASGIWAFTGNDWTQQGITGIPSGQYIKELVSDGTYLYARTEWDTGTVNTTLHTAVYRIDGSLTASTMTNSLEATHPIFNRLIVAGNTVVSSVKPLNSTANIRYVYLNGTTFNEMGNALYNDGGALCGAAVAGSTTYLASAKGLMSWAGGNNAPMAVGNTSSDSISGMATVGGEALAWSRNGGSLYRLTGTGDVTVTPTGANLDAAHCLYNYGGNEALLIAYDYSSTNSGYREILLAAGALPATPLLSTPGDSSDSTVLDQAQYKSSLGRYAIYAIHHWTDGTASILFAGTEAGLYYSLDRGDWKVWSTESHSVLD